MCNIFLDIVISTSQIVVELFGGNTLVWIQICFQRTLFHVNDSIFIKNINCDLFFTIKTSNHCSLIANTVLTESFYVAFASWSLKFHFNISIFRYISFWIYQFRTCTSNNIPWAYHIMLWYFSRFKEYNHISLYDRI